MSAWNPPWKSLLGWSIVGMNHYYAGGERRLFVALVDEHGRCIKEEGPDDEYLWNRLWRKANREGAVEGGGA